MTARQDEERKREAGEVEVVHYRMGAEGYRNVERYDVNRYQGAPNQYRQRVMANAYKRLTGDLRGKRVLDVGCGTGRGVADFVRVAAFAAGADASLDMLSVAMQKTAGDSRARFVNAYAQELPFQEAAFDLVISLNFLHLFSLDTQRKMVDEMKRVVKPGGVVIIELDNALHGILVGPYKRWSGRERGSLPWEIRYLVGDRCRIARCYGAVCPVFWRIFYRFPSFFSGLEKLEYLPLFNRLGQRIYCKIVTEAREATAVAEDEMGQRQGRPAVPAISRPYPSCRTRIESHLRVSAGLQFIWPL
jgi:ubiquinone/menaquinone biosynthesis C-methylase UbiE